MPRGQDLIVARYELPNFGYLAGMQELTSTAAGDLQGTTGFVTIRDGILVVRRAV